MTELDEWEMIWTRTLKHPCAKFSFDDQDQILATTSNNSLLAWRADGEDEDDDDCEVTLGFGDAANQDQDGPGITGPPTGPPTCSSFSLDGLLVALAHAGRISLWQIEGDEPGPRRLESRDNPDLDPERGRDHGADVFRGFSRGPMLAIHTSRPGLGSQATGKPKRSNTDDSASSAQSKNGSSRVRRVHTDPDTGYVVVEYAGAKATTQLVILERTSPAPLCRNTSGRIRSACSFGVWNGKGPSTWARSCGSGRWTCATSRTGPNPAGRKHFFIPHEKYLGGNDNVQARVGNKDEVIFPRRGELAVVWGGIGRSTG
ncbi:hypothetical protein MCOR04_006535 [Pyricularia oryzae]|nr:hypothetical protein MCOR04_006535 [Pyricularia oryzae]